MMKRLIPLLALPFLAALPANTAELKLLTPADRSLVRGVVTFQVVPEHGPGEVFITSPVIRIQDESARDVAALDAMIDRATGIFSVPLDTTRLKDGLYLVTVEYRTVFKGKPRDSQEDLTLGIRNGSARPGKVVVTAPEQPVSGDEPADVVVRVYDQKGKPMPAARVEVKVDKGKLDHSAEITDREGEAFVTVDSDEVADVTLTVKVEDLPPAQQVIRFVE